MSIVSISINRRGFATLNGEAIKNGVQVEVVDIEDGIVYADLEGDAFRSLKVALRTGAKPLAHVDNIEHGERVRHYPARPSF